MNVWDFAVIWTGISAVVLVLFAVIDDAWERRS